MGKWLIASVVVICLNIDTVTFSSGSNRCRMSRADVKRFVDIRSAEKLEIGSRYRVEGILYSGFEESGLIPEPFIGEEYLPLQKVNAFCVRIKRECMARLKSARDGKVMDRVVELKAVVVLENLTGSARELDPNQCALGTVRIEKVRSVRVRLPKSKRR